MSFLRSRHESYLLDSFPAEATIAASLERTFSIKISMARLL